ncbi:MAG: TolC family protein [Treponema sp.]|nr:TolC family protein [Treponema sp.]
MKKFFINLAVFSVLTVFSTNFCFAQTKAQSQSEKNNAAKDVQKISVEDAVILAADNNISLKRQKLELDVLEKKDKYSWNGISPSISLGAGYSDSFVSCTFGDGGYTSIDTGAGNWSLNGSLSFRLTPSLAASIKSAKLAYENGIVTYEEAVRSVELNVRNNFYGLLSTKENIALQERNMETARVRYENNRDKFSRGQLSELDLLNSQYNYESLKPKIQQSINTYENALASFKQILGLRQDQEIELVGSMDDLIPPENFELDVNIDEIPSVKKLKASIEAQKISLSSAKFSAWGPSVSASYSYSLGGKLESGAASSGRDSLSLNVSIPLDGYLPWSSSALSIDTQKSNLEKLQLQLEDSKTTASLSIENKIKSLRQMNLQIKTLDQNVEIAQRTYDMTLRAYNAGSKDLLTLQSASDSLMNARLTRQQQLYSILSAVLDLEDTLGIPFGSLGDKN